MFKKHVQAQSTHVLSGKDAKTLRRDILKQFPTCSEEQLGDLLPAKANVTQTKLLNSRCLVRGAPPLGPGGALESAEERAVPFPCAWSLLEAPPPAPRPCRRAGVRHRGRQPPVL